MSDLTIHKFSKDLQQRLSRRAARKGRSAEAEAREILREAVKDEPKRDLQQKSPKEVIAEIRARVERYGGFDFELPKRDRSTLIVKPPSPGK